MAWCANKKAINECIRCKKGYLDLESNKCIVCPDPLCWKCLDAYASDTTKNYEKCQFCFLDQPFTYLDNSLN